MARWFTVCGALFTTLVLPGCGQISAPATLWVQGGPYRLKTAVFPSAHSSSTPTLVVVLHGDSPFGKPDYQDTAAIGDLKQRFRSRRIVVVGHSGGAAITANVLGRHPSLVDAVL